MTQSIPAVFKSRFFCMAVSLASLMPCLALGQAVSTSGSFATSATVVQPLTITGTSTLSFGSFVAGGGGTVTIPSDAPFIRTSTSTTLSSPLSLVNSNVGAVSTISISGLKGTKYSVRLPANISLANSVGGSTMKITRFTTNLIDDTLIPDSGAQTFQIGGTLEVAANQTSGSYSATVPITITYE